MRRASAPPLLTSLLGVTLALAGCAEGSSDGSDGSDPRGGSATATATEAAPEDDRRDLTDADFAAVRRLLDMRAAAVVDADREAFLATVDEEGDESFREEQEAFFDNLQDLQVGRLYYGMVDLGLVPDEIDGGEAVLRPELYEHVQLEGVNKRPVANQVSITFVERDGRWLVGHEQLDETFKAQSRPWFGTRIEVADAPGLLVLTDVDAEVGAADLLESTQVALADVADVLGVPADEPMLVDATTNGQATTMTPSTEEQAAAVAFGTYATDRTGSDYKGRAGSVVKANPEQVDYLVDDGVTLRHELTHVVLDTDTLNLMPQWASEGIADYVGNYPLTMPDDYYLDDDVREVIEAREVRLVPPGRWGDDPTVDYLSANAFAQYLVEEYGMEKYLEMMRTFVRLGRETYNVYGEFILEDVLEEVYDTTPEAVARGGFALLLAIPE